MTILRCAGQIPADDASAPRTKSRQSTRSNSGNRASAELIEQTRQLMEQTIEFVPSPSFEKANALSSIQAIRPTSLDEPNVVQAAKPGLAFVTGLVQAPLLSQPEEHYLFTWMNFLKSRAERNRRRLDLNHPRQLFIDQINADLNEALRVRNHIVQGNLRLIVSQAKKLTGSLEQMSDLIGEGTAPLIRSAELFDIGLGNRFSTYATWAVRNQMLRWMKRSRRPADQTSGEDAPSLENLPDNRVHCDSTEVVPQLRLDAVNRLLSSLSERERSIIAARFGLEGHPQGQSLADIARQMGLSKERVRQIVLGSISKLRELIPYNEFDAMS